MNLSPLKSIKTYQSNFPLLVGFFILIYLWLISCSNSFFWDTVQFASLHAHFYLESNFSLFFLPSGIDSGHPPFFGIYIAGLWKLLSKSLFVSHLAMLPFLLLLGFQFYKLLCLTIENIWSRSIAMIVFCLDPCFAGQFVLVSPDVILLLGFVMSLRGLLEEKRLLLALGLAVMCMISMRGYMISAALGTFYLAKMLFGVDKKIDKPKFLKDLLVFVPGAILGITFLTLHYLHAGWIGYHEGSPWADSFFRVDMKGIIRNAAIIIWRLIDFGRFFMWIPILFYLAQHFRGKLISEELTKHIYKILLILFLWLLPSMLLHQYLTGHRYLLPIFLLGHLLCWLSLEKLIRNANIKKTIYVFIGMIIISGNFWVYPDKIAMGWDSTLAHLPYYEMRTEMIDFLDEEEIDIRSVGSQFPNVLPLKYIDLSDREVRFEHQDLTSQEYILYSNVFNDFSDQDIDLLQSAWIPIKKLSKMGVHMTLYKRP